MYYLASALCIIENKNQNKKQQGSRGLVCIKSVAKNLKSLVQNVVRTLYIIQKDQVAAQNNSTWEMELHANTQSHRQLIIPSSSACSRDTSRDLYIQHLLCSQTNEGTSNSFAWQAKDLYSKIQGRNRNSYQVDYFLWAHHF